MPQGRKWNGRPTIGLQISNLWDFYTRQIWPAVVDTCRENDVNLIIFNGNPVFSRSGQLLKHYSQSYSSESKGNYDFQNNIVYEYISDQVIDALVMTSGSLNIDLTPEESRELYSRHRDIPITSIALPIEGIPSVMVDNKSGMRDMVTHLIELHHHEKIAFIRGPETNQEAEERYEVFRSVMHEHGLKVDESLIMPGNFMWRSGYEAAEKLLAERPGSFDAVVAANDSMALAAMDVFINQGLKIPRDVAVCGFDDSDMSRYYQVPLATVRQPFYKQASKATQMAIDLINGKTVPLLAELPAEFIPRASCGCDVASQEEEETVKRHWAPIHQGDQVTEVPHAELQAMAVQVDEDVRVKHPSSLYSLDETIKWVYYFYQNSINPLRMSEILEQARGILGQRLSNQLELNRVIQLLAFMKFRLEKFFPGMEEILRFESIYQNTIFMLEESIQLDQGMQLIHYSNTDTMLIYAIQGIISKFRLHDLMDAIANELPKLGVASCYLSLYDRPMQHHFFEEWRLPRAIELKMAYDQEGRKELDPLRSIFPVRDIVPAGMKLKQQQFTYVLEALYFGDDQYGHVLFELGKVEGMIFELLRLQISSALKGSLMLQEQERVQKELEERILTMEGELDLARKIQLRLIPSGCPWPTVAYFYKPMTKVGGDFLDFIKFRNSDLLGVFISDVSGHGVPAALITSMIKTTLLQTASSQMSPAKVLEQLNVILIPQSADNFITAFYGIYNRRTRELVYANAGHNPPLVMTSQQIIAIGEKGRSMPLAILDNEGLIDLGRGLTDIRVQLEEGSKLLLYTDGLLEAVNIADKKNLEADELRDFETAALMGFLQDNRNLPGQVFVDRLMDRLKEFRGSDDYDDDVCIITLDVGCDQPKDEKCNS